MCQARQRRRGWVLLVLGMLVSSSEAADGRDPYLVVTAKSVDSLLIGAKWALTSGGAPETASLMDNFLQGLTQGKGLSCFDRTKPLGAYLSARDPQAMDLVVFVPVTDSKALLDLLRPYFPNQTTSSGLTVLEGSGRQIYSKVSRGYSFFSLSAQALEAVAVPSSRSRHDISVETSFTRLSREAKKRLFEEFEKRLFETWRSMPAQRGALFFGGESGRKRYLNSIETLMKDGDVFTVGLTLNQASGRVELEWEALASPGTELASSFARFGRTSTAFSALLNQEAPLCMLWATPIEESLKEEVAQVLKDASEEAEMPAGTAALVHASQESSRSQKSETLASLRKVLLEMDRLDIALVLGSTPAGKLQVLLAAKAANSSEVQKLVEGLPKLAAGADGIDEINLDVAKIGAARVHSIGVTGKLREVLGGGPVHLAVRNEQLFLAVGGDTLATLKSALNQTASSGARLPPITFRVRPSKLIELFGDVKKPPVESARRAFSGKGDLAAFEVIPIDRGMKARLALGEGFLRFFVSQAKGTAPTGR